MPCLNVSKSTPIGESRGCLIAVIYESTLNRLNKSIIYSHQNPYLSIKEGISSRITSLNFYLTRSA